MEHDDIRVGLRKLDINEKVCDYCGIPNE